MAKLIISKKTINILGVIFDSKLQWTEQVANASSKALKAAGAIRLIKRFFTKTEIMQLITSNVFSILYYNSEIWHLPSLKAPLKQKLLSVSARALKMSMYYPDRMISYKNIHKMNRRALPDSMLLYRLSIQLFKLYNTNDHSLEWISLNLNQILTSRQSNFEILRTNVNKVGLNILVNRLSALNGKIPLDWLRSSLDTFKIKVKRLFL